MVPGVPVPIERRCGQDPVRFLHMPVGLSLPTGPVANGTVGLEGRLPLGCTRVPRRRTRWYRLFCCLRLGRRRCWLNRGRWRLRRLDSRGHCGRCRWSWCGWQVRRLADLLSPAGRHDDEHCDDCQCRLSRPPPEPPRQQPFVHQLFDPHSPRARSRSAIRSSAFSRPTDTRSRSSGVGLGVDLPYPSMESPVLDQAFVAAQARSTGEQGCAGRDRERCIPAAPNSERQHPAEHAHLSLGDFVSAVACKPPGRTPPGPPGGHQGTTPPCQRFPNGPASGRAVSVFREVLASSQRAMGLRLRPSVWREFLGTWGCRWR